MYKKLCTILVLTIIALPGYSAKTRNPAKIIASEPVTMMDLGLLKLNTVLSRPHHKGLNGAKMGARYDHRRGNIEIKVSMDVKKASKASCVKVLNHAKDIFVRTIIDKKNAKKKKVSNIHYYFEHEGTAYRNKINWKKLPNHVVITAIAITRKNYQHSVFCKSRLMSNKVSY